MSESLLHGGKEQGAGVRIKGGKFHKARVLRKNWKKEGNETQGGEKPPPSSFQGFKA